MDMCNERVLWCSSVTIWAAINVLAKSSQYKLVMKYGPSDPWDMRVMKHFVKTMAPRTVNG